MVADRVALGAREGAVDDVRLEEARTRVADAPAVRELHGAAHLVEFVDLETRLLGDLGDERLEGDFRRSVLDLRRFRRRLGERVDDDGGG